MGSYRDLELYKTSLDLVERIYKDTSSFPKHELFGLSSQLRRAAVSIPSNVAEGSGRNNRKEFIQFLYIANGSLSELETQLDIALRLGYLSDISAHIENIKYIRKLLLGLVKYLQAKDPKAIRDANNHD